jgi:hypothetical protein
VEETVIIKDSWPPEEIATAEASALDQCRGLWGVPTLLGAHRVLDADKMEQVYIPHGAVLEIERGGSMDEREAEEESVDVKMEAVSQLAGPINTVATDSTALRAPKRHHMRLVFSTDGTSLVHAKSPAELLQAVIHVLIGM